MAVNPDILWPLICGGGLILGAGGLAFLRSLGSRNRRRAPREVDQYKYAAPASDPNAIVGEIVTEKDIRGDLQQYVEDAGIDLSQSNGTWYTGDGKNHVVEDPPGDPKLN